MAAGHRRAALDMLTRSGGVMLGHLHGPAAAREVLDALGPDPDPRVTALRAMAALKAGHTGHAAALLDAAGPAAVVRASAVAGNFQMMNRLVDATGVPVGASLRAVAADLGLDG